jgi:hypothetical protein
VGRLLGRAGQDVHLSRRSGERDAGRARARPQWSRSRVTTERVDLGTHACSSTAARSARRSTRGASRISSRRGRPAAYDWLSRGLVEGLESFIGQAGAGDALLGAFFEFKNTRIYAALRAARSRGATVAILYDGDSQRAANEAAMEGQGLDGMVKPRTRSGGFAHNKFLVLSRGGQASEVWTGSTNLSENGVYGHSNNAHWCATERSPTSTRATGTSSTRTGRRSRPRSPTRRSRPCPRPAAAARSRPSSRRAARSTRSTPTRRSPAAPRARSS